MRDGATRSVIEQPAALGRFRVLGRLGEGSSGAVYEAHDPARDGVVALKKLSRLNAETVVRFKQEFRSLSELTHPNLVRFYELHSVDDGWLLSMELVRGRGFVSWVRGAALDLERLRDALRQLAGGVFAIHAGGRVHGDLKPDNVLVTEEGRVVILDFGLARAMVDAEADATDSNEASLAGTPAYMAPELARGGAVGPAIDWYAIGTILYEALTGRLPFEGPAAEMLAGKARAPVPDPRGGAAGLPDDLCALCVELLRPDPAERPTGARVLELLGASADRGSQPTGAPALLVGRAAEIGRLDEAARATQTGAPVTVVIQGASGMGKTALVRGFLARLADERAVVLQARCHERELVPYKALDSLVEAIALHLRRLDALSVAALLPRDILALARLFPILRRVETIGAAPRRAAPPDPHELRRRAFAALRDLLGRIADRGRVVVFLDDLQWADGQSTALLMELLAPPDPPALLLLLSVRPEEPSAPEVLEAIAQARRRHLGADIRELVLGPMSEDEASALAAALLSGAADDPVRAARARAIARESGGNPFFVHELVLSANQGRPSSSSPALGDLVRDRIDAVPEPARRLLQIVALAGRPIALSTARRAAGADATDDALAALRGAGLAYTKAAGAHVVLETAHDRIRQCVLDALSPEARRACHTRLAEALLEEPSPDPEALAIHFIESGQHDLARRYAVASAERAAEALAFERAASLYWTALDIAPAAEAPGLRLRLAEALAAAGRGPEAAATFLAASRDGESPVESKRKAAEQYLRSGHIEDGLAVGRDVLAAVGLRLPPDARRARRAIALNRARLWLRGRRFHERPESEVPAEDLTRLDVCWSIGNGLAGVDLIRGADFQLRHLLLALAAGEPYRIARALAWQSSLCSIQGGAGARERAAALSGEAEEIAQRIAHPHALGWAVSAAAIGAWCGGRWRESAQLCEYTEALFRERCTDIAWEVATLQIWWWLPALLALGEAEELARRAATCAREAESRGDRYALVSVRTYVTPWSFLFAGDLDQAQREADEALRLWARESWDFQHWAHLASSVTLALARGDGRAGHALLAAGEGQIHASSQDQVQHVRVHRLDLRARCCLLAASSEGPGESWLAQAERDAAGLEAEAQPWPLALAELVHAGVAAQRGAREQAADRYGRAAASLARLEMPLHAAAARWRSGELRSEPGGGLAREAREAFASRSIAEPERIAALLAPPMVPLYPRPPR